MRARPQALRCRIDGGKSTSALVAQQWTIKAIRVNFIGRAARAPLVGSGTAGSSEASTTGRGEEKKKSRGCDDAASTRKRVCTRGSFVSPIRARASRNDADGTFEARTGARRNSRTRLEPEISLPLLRSSGSNYYAYYVAIAAKSVIIL